jgi:hypothetical protein
MICEADSNTALAGVFCGAVAMANRLSALLIEKLPGKAGKLGL